MTPEVPEVPLPLGRGGDAVRYLESLGLVAKEPPIYSSQLATYQSSPFLYYLVCRLGLVQGLRESEALSRGSWLHTCFEMIDKPPTEVRSRVEGLWPAREREIRNYAALVGVKGDSLDATLDREFKDMRCAVGWYLAALSVKCDSRGTTLQDFLLGPQWQPLTEAVELEVRSQPKGFKVPIAGKFDRIAYHKFDNALWVIDYKSTSDSPVDRLAYCTVEYQTWLYLFLLRAMMERGDHTRLWGLPRDTQMGGIIHVAIQKPTINLGMNDRPFREVPFTPSSGKNKGITRIEKEYYGEPDLDLYIQRCARWYRGEGEFANKESERESSPPVNYSLTHGVLLDEVEDEFWTITRRLHEEATRPPLPQDFPRGGWKPGRGKSGSAYLPFFVCPFQDWPAIILKNGFIISHRYQDGETPE